MSRNSCILFCILLLGNCPFHVHHKAVFFFIFLDVVHTRSSSVTARSSTDSALNVALSLVLDSSSLSVYVGAVRTIFIRPRVFLLWALLLDRPLSLTVGSGSHIRYAFTAESTFH